MTDLLDITAENVSTIAPFSGDITFTHSVFAQCFLPLRRPKADEKLYQVRHGNATLAIQAGVLLNPQTKQLEQQNVPSGSAARIVLSHIHNHIIRSSSLDEAIYIPMGESLRRFFDKYRLKIGGKNGKQIMEQVNNVAAAHITIGIWTDTHAKQIDLPKVSREIDFWLEKDHRQRSLWQPSMVINPEYAATIRDRAVPLDMRTLVGLYEKPRAMDVFTWLSYRLPQQKNPGGTFIPYFGDNGLHSIFGRGLKSQRLFKSEFVKSLKEVAQWYPEARISIENKGIRVFPSPSPVPAEHSLSSGRSLFFVDKPM